MEKTGESIIGSKVYVVNPNNVDKIKKYFLNRIKNPTTDYTVLKEVLVKNDFIQHYDDEVIYFVKGDRKVILPKENRIFGLTIHDIIHQSGINNT